MKPYAEIKTATKQLVDHLLSINTNNRSVKRSVVERYAEDIKNGKWMLTNQGIGVTSDNVLADGQHRLIALKECGYPSVQLLIVYGLNPDVQIAVDAHAKRSARDLLYFAFGARVSHRAPAIASCILKDSRNKFGGCGFTNSQLMDCINEYSDEINAVVNAPKSANFFAAPYLAAFALALKQNPEKSAEIIQFMHDTEAGENLTKLMPAYHLRNLVITSTSGNGSSLQQERFLKTRKALAAFLSGQTVGVLRA